MSGNPEQKGGYTAAASYLRFGGVSQFDVAALRMYFSYANVCHAAVTRHDIHQHLLNYLTA